MAKQLNGFEPGKTIRAFFDLPGRSVREGEAIDRQDERGDTGDYEGPARSSQQRFARKPGTEHGSQPILQPLRIGSMHFVPVHQDEGKRPRRQNPTNGATNTDQAKLLLRVLYIRERDRIGDGIGGDVQQAMDQHQTEKRPKRCRKREQEYGHASDQMTESQVSFGGKIAIGKLVAEKHADNCRDGERVENPRLLRRREPKAREVSINERQPASPNKEL